MAEVRVNATCSLQACRPEAARALSLKVSQTKLQKALPRCSSTTTANIHFAIRTELGSMRELCLVQLSLSSDRSLHDLSAAKNLQFDTSTWLSSNRRSFVLGRVGSKTFRQGGCEDPSLPRRPLRSPLRSHPFEASLRSPLRSPPPPPRSP